MIVIDVKLNVKLIDEKAKIPTFSHKGDAGFDLYACSFELGIGNIHSYILMPHWQVTCNLGFATEIPKGYYCQIVPRSGLATKGITIINSPATIDAGYRGVWKVILYNLGKEKVELKTGQRIAQGILRKVIDFEFELVDTLSESERGSGGLGSTGK